MTRAFACVLAIVVLTVACARRDKPAAGAIATRVVSLSPATTETLFAIGAGSLAVGRSRYCDHPPEARALPEVGGVIDPSLEAILALRPDLVVGADAQRPLAAKLEPRGVATFFPTARSLDDVYAMIEGVGARTGRATEAARIAARVRDAIAAIERAVKDEPRPRVLFVFGVQPIVVAGPGTFADEMLRRAGADNAVTSGGEYPTLGIERVIALDADVVLNAALSEQHGDQRIAAEAPGWKNVRAVKSGRVVAIDDERVLRPGPRIADGLAVVARALHPAAAIP
jgi:iron complex transport system substrate-binding protein